MRNLLNPRWILITNTLPLAVLFFIFFGEYQIIKSILEEETIKLWYNYGTALAILGLLAFGYAVFKILKKQNISIAYGIIVLLSYIPFLYLYAMNMEKIIPFSIPRWMTDDYIQVYVWTFLMPTIIHALFILVLYATPDGKEHTSWKNFLIAFAIPVGCYVGSQVLLPLWRKTDRQYNVHVFLIFIIIITLLFFFFLIRGFLIIATKKTDNWKKYQLVWKIPIAIILPLLGLSINNGHYWNNDFFFGNSGIFGDFKNYWFYILAIINGILICLPAFNNPKLRIALFVARSITFAYTFYFFLVFFPFLPFSVFAVVFFGIGFLMLAPLILFIIHVNELYLDFLYLKGYYAKKRLIAIFILSIAVIPLVLNFSYLKDKHTLTETLNYVYNPDYSKSYSIDKKALRKMLERMKTHKSERRDIFKNNKQPYLSSYYNWIVFDHLTLSEEKINHIESIFFGERNVLESPSGLNRNIEITHIATDCTYDSTQQAWKSWINLEITNHNQQIAGLGEYVTTFELPEGCWISDYYLYVGDRKEKGILAEKKSAMWIYSRIRNIRRDPGILYYLTGRQVAFQVYPFIGGEVRKTGIEFIHKEPIQLNVDGHKIELGRIEEAPAKGFENKYVTYLTAQEKEQLKKIVRKPYLHFVLDVSNPDEQILLCNQIDSVINKNPILSENAKISLVNSFVSTYPLQSNWKQKLADQTSRAGFFFDMAIKTILFNATMPQTDTYPIIVVVTSDFSKAILEKDFADWEFAYPENDLFYVLKNNIEFEPHSLSYQPFHVVKDTLPPGASQPVLEYAFDDKVVFLPNNAKPSVVLKSDRMPSLIEEMEEKSWESGLIMQGKWTSQILHPESSDKEWLNLIKASFKTQLMSPVTSYLALENDAQKAILRQKQEQILSGNKSLDFEDEVQRMSEPEIFVLIAFILLVLWHNKSKLLKKKQSEID